MQTFLPSQDFGSIASVLDNKRLNKQALEGWQLIMTNLSLDPEGNFRNPKGWRNHPAAIMWRGHELSLAVYIDAMVVEWKSRGYRSTIADKAWATIDRASSLGLLRGQTDKLPDWFYDTDLVERITASHRTALLSKHYEHYSQFGWQEDPGFAPSTYDYVWPSEVMAQ
jgi:hypothetical protein